MKHIKNIFVLAFVLSTASMYGKAKVPLNFSSDAPNGYCTAQTISFDDPSGNATDANVDVTGSGAVDVPGLNAFPFDAEYTNPGIHSIEVTDGTETTNFGIVVNEADPATGMCPDCSEAEQSMICGYRAHASCTNHDGAFEDISGTGTALGIADDGGAHVTTSFPFPFFGQTTMDFVVNDNGTLHVGATAAGSLQSDFDNEGLGPLTGDGGFTGTVIAPYWDDLFPVAGTSEAYFQDFGTYAIFQWEQYELFNGPAGETITFQVYIGDDGTILFRYEDTLVGDPANDNGQAATIGISGAGAAYNISHLSCSILMGTDCISFSPVVNHIPTLSNWGIIIMSLLLLSLAVVAIRKTRMANA